MLRRAGFPLLVSARLRAIRLSGGAQPESGEMVSPAAWPPTFGRPRHWRPCAPSLASSGGLSNPAVQAVCTVDRALPRRLCCVSAVWVRHGYPLHNEGWLRPLGRQHVLLQASGTSSRPLASHRCLAQGRGTDCGGITHFCVRTSGEIAFPTTTKDFVTKGAGGGGRVRMIGPSSPPTRFRRRLDTGIRDIAVKKDRGEGSASV